MPLKQPKDFAKTLAGEKFVKDDVYLLYGSEPKRVLDAASMVKNKLVESCGEENYFRYMRLGGGQDEVSASEVVSQLNTVSMFGGGKVVWIGPLEKVDKNSAETLAGYALNPNPESTLIIALSVGKGDNRALKSLDKSPLVEAVKAGGTVVRFTPPRGAETGKWVETRFRSKGLAIERPALETLVELTGGDLAKLDGEIEKLASYIGDENTVSLKAVEATVGDHRMDNVWSLTNAVRSKNMEKAFSALLNLLENNQPPQMILKMLATEITVLASARHFHDRGESFDAFVSAMGGSSFALRGPWENARRWDRSSFVTGLRAVLDTAMNMMQAGVSPETALSCLVATLCHKPVKV